MSDEALIRDSLRELLPEAEPVSIQFHSRSLFPLYRVELADGRLLAAKTVKSPRMARTESDALQALTRAGAPAPHCYGYHTAASSRAALILMDFLEPEHGSGMDPARNLVEDLVRLYTGEANHYGWHEDNFIGTLPQPNRQHDSFAEFWWEDRIEAQIRRAREASRRLDRAFAGRIEAVVRSRIEDWSLNRVRPRLIHGDLWSGNLLRGPGGRFYLIDPSIAYGNPEQDLGMLELFGCPLSADSLQEIVSRSGLADGYAERTAFWQIYPLLVHVNIFGDSYVGQLEQCVRRYE